MTEEPLFEPVRRTRAYEMVVDQIETAIRKGALMPGDQLPSERELMEQFQLGRSTIREALRVLESRVLVAPRSADKRGFEVLAFSPHSLMQSIHSLVQLERITLQDLIFFRMVVEGALAGLAASCRDVQSLKVLWASIENMQEAAHTGGATFAQADVLFHEKVTEIADNEILTVCRQVVRSNVQNLITDRIASGVNRHEQMLEALQRHKTLYMAISDGDSKRALRVAQTNLFEYYSSHLPITELDRLKMLLD